MESTTEIKVYGDEAKAITKGQIFVATVENVEGRDVVTLKPTLVLSSIEEECYGVQSILAIRIRKLLEELKN